MVDPGQARMGVPVNEISRSLSFCGEDPGEKLERSSRNARLHWAFVILLLTLLFSCASAWAQKDTGVIAGTVKDPSGAVVVGAKVRVTDVDRTTKFDTTTDGNGEYVAGPLKVGRYTITVEKTNFKTAVAGPVQLDVQGRIEANVKLEIGQVSQEVEVTVQNPLLETETSTMGEVMDETRIETLPLNGRNFAQLAQLGAGVVPSEPGSRVSGSFGFSVDGARSLQNNFLLDGIDNNSNLGDVLNESSYVIQPPIDAIEEFKVQTNDYSAEFGRGNGAILNAVIKSGTNAFHGDVFEYFRNDVLDASPFFIITAQKPAYKQNQFGATFGGPIQKGKTFFFVDYEGFRLRQGIPQTATVPDPNMVGGDFSELLQTGVAAPQVDMNGNTLANTVAVDCSGNPTYFGEIFNARLTQVSALNPNGFCGVPIGVDASGNPTNIFPSGSIDPLAARLATLIPPPNSSNPAFNYIAVPVRSETRNNFDVRLDHTFSSKDSIFGRFSYENQPSFIPPPFQNELDGGGFFDGNEDFSYRSVALSETHLLDPNHANEFRFGYNRINAHRYQINYNENVAGGLGFPGVPYEAGTFNGGLPALTFSDGSAPELGSSGFLPSIEKQNSYVLTDNFTWLKGRHSLKFGAEIRFEQFTIFQPSASRGTADFNAGFTDNPASPGTGGYGFASFLLGLSDGGSIVNLHNVEYRRQIYAGFVQDDFKKSAHLTLNLGLRYELYTTVKAADNEQANFDFGCGCLIVPQGQNAQLTPTLAGQISIERTGSPGLVSPDLHNFAPRVGLAYKINDKLVLRSSYGIFYGGQENGPYSNPSPGFNPPFFVTQAFNMPCSINSANPNPGQVDCSIPGFNSLQQGFPANSLVDPNTPLFFSISPNISTPFMQQWFLGFQYALPANIVAEISYVGSHGANLFGLYNGNQAVPTADTTIPLAPRRPDPNIDGGIDTLRSNLFSNYNGLQLRLEKRLSNGLEFEAAYTYSHALDDASSASLGSQNQGDFRLQTAPYLEYSNADFDIRHRFVFNFVYDLPFGSKQRFGSNLSGFRNQIVGNWQVTGIISAQTGNWFTPTDDLVNISNSDCGGEVFNCARPNVVGNPNGKPCVPGTLFNTCAFAANTVFGTFGDAGRNIIRGPGLQNWDRSFIKQFPVHEQMHFEFRAEFFNIWNHPNLSFADVTTTNENFSIERGTSQFGFPTASLPPRLIQFALKFYF
jgi:Carboxypeptidase regulatory-like domain/TonB dependent receptor/TonB-dependent Receptor Plug Domain